VQTDDDDKRHTSQPENYVAGHLITPLGELAPETNLNATGVCWNRSHQGEQLVEMPPRLD